MRTYDALRWMAPAALLAVVGCSSYPAPTRALQASRDRVREAQQAGASGQSESATYLRLAQEQIDMANALMDNGQNKRAEYYLLRARADADLARALAVETTAKAEAQQAMDQVRAMQQKVGP